MAPVQMLKFHEQKGNSLITTVGAVCILVLVVFLVTALSIDNTQTDVERILAEKGSALISALESGVRSGVRSKAGLRLQYLVEEMASRTDVQFIAVTMPDGTIIAHSDTERIGKKLMIDYALPDATGSRDCLVPTEDPAWKIVMTDGLRTFLVYGLFHPGWHSLKNIRSALPPVLQTEFQGRLPSVFLGLDMTPIITSQKKSLQRALLFSGSTVLAGILALLFLHGIERFRASRHSQQIAEKIAQELASTLSDGLIILDNEGMVTRVNSAALNLFSLPGRYDFYTGQTLDHILPPNVLHTLRKLFSSASIPDTEIRIKDGEKNKFISVRGGHIRDNNHNRIGTLLFFRDLTEVRRLEEEIRRNEKLAAVGNLAAGVAHELRNPLSSIKGYAVYFCGKFQRGSSDREAAEVMIREVDRLNRCVSDLIGLARPTILNKRPVNVLQICQDVLRLIQRDVETRGVAVQLNAPENLPAVLVDCDRFRQVLLNLCLNALEAMKEGGNLLITLGLEGHDFFCEVQDTGMGMNPEVLDHIFEPYFTTKGDGTGLGLAVVHKIIAAHEGSISVASEPGIGSLFHISLPLNATHMEG
ncbi:MAG: ATP-binding protein [Desulfovibrionaceae bacterium]|nr:ATP-binding protein [Desulfovibrionaceae bacterium]